MRVCCATAINTTSSLSCPLIHHSSLSFHKLALTKSTLWHKGYCQLPAPLRSMASDEYFLTDDEAQPGTREAPNPKRQRQRPPKSAAATAAKSSNAALSTLARRWKQCRDAKVGCSFCLGRCLADFEQRADELKAFHEELATLSREVQDVHLAWIIIRSPGSL